MLTTALALSALGALACAVVYGTDVFAALVLRPALAALDDSALVQAAGRIHQYADQRMPLPGAVGTLAAAAATLTAGLGNHPLQTLLAAARWSRCWRGWCCTSGSPRLSTAGSPRRPPLMRYQQTRENCRNVGTASSACASPCRPSRCAARQRARVHMRRRSPNSKEATCRRWTPTQAADDARRHELRRRRFWIERRPRRDRVRDHDGARRNRSTEALAPSAGGVLDRPNRRAISARRRPVAHPCRRRVADDPAGHGAHAGEPLRRRPSASTMAIAQRSTSRSTSRISTASLEPES